VTKTITLLGGIDQTSFDGEVGLLFECAPDSAIKRAFPGAISLPELIGDFDSIKQCAFALAHKLLEKEPPLRGLRQLGVFYELVIRELQHIQHAKTLHDRLVADGISNCVFGRPSRFVQDLQWFSQRLGSSIAVAAPEAAGSVATSGMRRSWQRMRLAGFSGSAISSEWRQVMERVDFFHRRAIFARSKPRRLNAIWFYSTAYTFTRAGLMYEPYFPGPFEYLVENPQTGGLPLTAIGRSFASPYEYSKCSMAPSAREIAEARTSIRKHLQAVDLPPDEAVVRDAYLASPGFATFIERLLPLGLFQTRLFERFVEAAAPAALVVGNPVFEGYALHAAGKAGIPTLLLQHGILGDYCQFVDPPADHYIVRGEFWREFLAPKARERSLVLNPAEPAHAVESVQGPRRMVVFLTAPYGMQEYWNESDLDDILLALLAACREGRADLVIRVHPMEQVGTYESVVQRLAALGGEEVKVSYSQGAGLDDLLQRSSVAVTFSSTAFLDCLRHGVPIVSFGWHDFSYKRQIAEYGVFHFCESLAELGQLVQKVLQGELPAFASSTAPFLANTPEAELKGQIQRLLDVRMVAA